MELNIEKMEQGNIPSLFPNLGKEVVCNGCICIIIGIKKQEVQMEVIQPFKSGYKVGATFWNSSFLIQ